MPRPKLTPEQRAQRTCRECPSTDLVGNYRFCKTHIKGLIEAKSRRYYAKHKKKINQRSLIHYYRNKRNNGLFDKNSIITKAIFQ